MSKVLEIDAATGQHSYRDLTTEEQAQYEADLLTADEAAAAAAAKAEADAAAAAATIAHAKSLGFTDAMIAVMYPNLGSN